MFVVNFSLALTINLWYLLEVCPTSISFLTDFSIGWICEKEGLKKVFSSGVGAVVWFLHVNLLYIDFWLWWKELICGIYWKCTQNLFHFQWEGGAKEGLVVQGGSSCLIFTWSFVVYWFLVMMEGLLVYSIGNRLIQNPDWCFFLLWISTALMMIAQQGPYCWSLLLLTRLC